MGNVRDWVFFQKLFRKDHHFYTRQGEKLLGQERFADARHAFSEALHYLPADLPDCDSSRNSLTQRIALCGRELAIINLQEAEFALQQGNSPKAAEHLVLIRDLTDDVDMRNRAAEMLLSCSQDKPVAESASHGCGGGCSGSHESPVTADEDEGLAHFLAPSDRFELLINTLPGDLPSRYAGMGEVFAQAYLDAAEGNYEAALQSYQALIKQQENDILLHEIAAIMHRHGDLGLSEQLLRKALSLNPSNPLVSLSLVHLFMETGRPDDALERLDALLAAELMQEQALLLKGDILLICDRPVECLETYSRALSFPKAAKGAAERMVPILERTGRSAEAQHLFKRYLKGCC